MNTIPDEALLALWLDDELEGEELARVEAWAATQPEQLAAREEVRAWRKMISTTVPAAEEPPYPDFFNSRIEKAIRELPHDVPAVPAVRSGGSIWSWLFPASAFAGMALAFWVGTKATGTRSAGPVVSIADHDGQPAVPEWYTPEQGVDAVWLKGKGAGSSVIVLQGVSAIPDSLDFTETVSYQRQSDTDATVGNSDKAPAR